MERRRFLAGVAAVVGGIAIEEAIPLGRVWSFPSKVKTLNLSYPPLGMVTLNGLVLCENVDYKLVGSVLTFKEAPAIGDIMQVFDESVTTYLTDGVQNRYPLNGTKRGTGQTGTASGRGWRQ